MNGFLNLLRYHINNEWGKWLLTALGLSIFVSILVIISDAIKPAEVEELMAKLPPQMLAFAGLSNGMKMPQESWLGLMHNHPLWLILVMSFPFVTGLRNISGRIQDGTLELILAQPISRAQYYLSLAAVLVLGMTLLILCSSVAALSSAKLFDQAAMFKPGLVLRMALSGWAFGVAVTGLALLCSSADFKNRSGQALTVILVLSFFIRYLSQIWKPARPLRVSSVFYYHNPLNILSKGFNGAHFATLVAIGLLSAAIGYGLFRRRGLSF